MSDSSDIRSLFAEYARGEIGKSELERLDAALRGNSQLTDEFIEYMNVASALGDIAALSDVEVAAAKAELRF